jgi:hypothetical protein
MENCIEAYPDYNQALNSCESVSVPLVPVHTQRSRAAVNASLSSRDAIRDHLDAKRRWEVHGFTCPHARSINQRTTAPDEPSVMEGVITHPPNARQKVNHRGQVPSPHQCEPLEGECRLDVSNLFNPEEYRRVCVRCFLFFFFFF